MSVYLPGFADPFIFEFPVTRQVLEGVVLTPDILKTHDHINLMIKRLEVSTTSTLLVAELQGEAGEGEGNFLYKSFNYEPFETSI